MVTLTACHLNLDYFRTSVIETDLSQRVQVVGLTEPGKEKKKVVYAGHSPMNNDLGLACMGAYVIAV